MRFGLMPHVGCGLNFLWCCFGSAVLFMCLLVYLQRCWYLLVLALGALTGVQLNRTMWWWCCCWCLSSAMIHLASATSRNVAYSAGKHCLRLYAC